MFETQNILINNYYPTSTLGDNLSTSSGTLVAMKIKKEVPRNIRDSKGLHKQLLPDKYPRGQLVHQLLHMGGGEKQNRSTEECSSTYFEDML